MPMNRGLPSAPQKPAALAKLRLALQNMQHALNLMAVRLRLLKISEKTIQNTIFSIFGTRLGASMTAPRSSVNPDMKKIAAVITDNTLLNNTLRRGCYPFRLFTAFIGVPYPVIFYEKTVHLPWHRHQMFLDYREQLL
ncbi:MAG: hypothetical protein GY862_38455 [Gammaproteobacteria bacterium]|nr:hypothetical protein [Gammaproteobacteria bacterium]